MKRKIYQDLLNWKNTKDNKPLMILGARQVGKTYIIDKFCETEFKNYIKINLLNDINIVELYNKQINSDEKYNLLKVAVNFDIDKPDTVIFIDEIQKSESLISELKYFCEEHNNLKIICAGSLLGVKLKRSKSSFPVGKVSMLNMYPMDFEEFLLALDKETLLNEIKKHYESNKEFMLHEEALKYYRYYLYTGGMPESVKNFVNCKEDLTNYVNVKKDIIGAYIKDMKQYVTSDEEVIKIEKTYKSIPNQIANKSNKFQYSKIDKNARTRNYELPLDWVNASNIVLTSNRVSTPMIPLMGYKMDDYFKLFINDIGLLTEMLQILPIDILTDNLSLFKGAIVENYIAQVLSTNNNSLFYWVSDGKAEIDFLLYNKDGIIPIEVKAGDNTKSKSLNTYIDTFKPKYSIRISTNNFGYDNRKNIKIVPLYAAFLIK